jgi:hypothetical protein
MCHSGNELGFCLKVTRHVEENLTIWFSNVTFAEGTLFTYSINIQCVFSTCVCMYTAVIVGEVCVHYQWALCSLLLGVGRPECEGTTQLSLLLAAFNRTAEVTWVLLTVIWIGNPVNLGDGCCYSAKHRE